MRHVSETRHGPCCFAYVRILLPAIIALLALIQTAVNAQTTTPVPKSTNAALREVPEVVQLRKYLLDKYERAKISKEDRERVYTVYTSAKASVESTRASKVDTAGNVVRTVSPTSSEAQPPQATSADTSSSTGVAI